MEVDWKFYTQLVEQNVEYKFENKMLTEQVQLLKKLTLDTLTNTYNIREYPQHRHNINSFNFPISSAKELIKSRFFTKQDLIDHINAIVIENGYDVETTKEE